MKPHRIVRNLAVLGIILCNIGCDQVSKTIVRKKLDYNSEISLLKDHFVITKVENSGAFLSLGDSLPPLVKYILLSLLPVAALASGLYFLVSRNDIPKPILVAICFVIGGGIGNLYDRILYGSVTDFLHIDFGIFRTGIFNMADVSIMAGMLMILFYYSNFSRLANSG